MLMLLNLALQKVWTNRGVVSMEWIILGAVIMAAIVLAFAPTFQTALTAAVTAIGNELTTQITAAGS